MDDQTARLALERHWNASDAGDFNVEHEIYREDAVFFIRNRASRSAVGITSKRVDSSSQIKSALRSGELLEAAISGLLNSYLAMTTYHLMR